MEKEYKTSEYQRAYMKEYYKVLNSFKKDKKDRLSPIIHSEEYMFYKIERAKKRKEERMRQKLLKTVA